MEKHGMHHVGHLKEVSFVGTPESMKERMADTRAHMKKRKHMRHAAMKKMRMLSLYK